MCDSKEEGGRRCPQHRPAARRTARAAVRLYGSNNAITRAAVEALPPAYVHGTLAERARIAATSTDQALLKLAARDPKSAVVEALATNPAAKEIRLLKSAREGEVEVVRKEPTVLSLADSMPSHSPACASAK